MTWLGLISLGLSAEVLLIILLGRGVTNRHEALLQADDQVPAARRAAAPAQSPEPTWSDDAVTGRSPATDA